ncbi:hypothetical protein PIB30_019907 [Stylosanthes scabra]|uniref:Uncharacterized protein n=1 Tax=Stylosanthes scabra TaxID=79078 RepID=A0ABU6V7C6_9FABA|nr:hypothetical protein [Stylosanthes scabra]
MGKVEVAVDGANMAVTAPARTIHSHYSSPFEFLKTPPLAPLFSGWNTKISFNLIQFASPTCTSLEERFGGRTAILADKGRPVPDPPQLLHAMRPEPAQVRQPASRSDQRLQRQVTVPVPLQVGQRGIEPGPAMGFWSITDLTITAPASTLRPVASWLSTIGAMVDTKE